MSSSPVSAAMRAMMAKGVGRTDSTAVANVQDAVDQPMATSTASSTHAHTTHANPHYTNIRTGHGSLAKGMVRRFLDSELFATKSIDDLQAEGAKSRMKRSLGVLDLTSVGIGGIIGTGIFVLTGTVAARNAGPAVVLSFIIAGFAALFAALCYAELASMIPIAGSAYTYTAASLGALPAWIIGWDLILEYLIGAATVAVGWSAYLVLFLKELGVSMSPAWTDSPVKWDIETQTFLLTGHYINLPAVVLTLAITTLLVVGIQESARVNTAIVIVKVIVVVLFILATMNKVDTRLWHPFIPPNDGTFGHYGMSGVLQGASTIFFAYIGFDAVSTTAEECKNPQKDLPMGTLLSLAICTALYIAVALIVTGLVPYQELNVANPISYAVSTLPGMQWLTFIISVGALAGLTSVMLVSLMGQPRIFYSMASDGLFPEFATAIHPRFKTPYITTIITGVTCAVVAGLLPIDVLSELSSIGTLFAFFMVSIGVLVLRLRRPDLPRKFRVPGGPYVIPLLGAASSGMLVCTATPPTIARLMGWMAVGLVIYFTYGRKRSRELKTFQRRNEASSAAEDDPEGERQSSGSSEGSGSGRRVSPQEEQGEVEMAGRTRM